MNSQTSIFSLKASKINGEIVDLKRYEGKKLLIVNTASECGYTPQYEALQMLHEQYGDKMSVLAFPCNQFGGQEPAENDQIAQFCERKYHVGFDLFAKIEVLGKHQHPIYQWLTTPEMNGWNSQEPTWNFCKYLIDEKGVLKHFYPAGENPMDTKILDWVTT